MLAEIVRELGPENVPTERAALYRKILGQDSALVNWVRADAAEIRAIYALAYRMVGEQSILGEEQLGEWVRSALEQESGESANNETVISVVDALRQSRFFVEEEERDMLGRRIGFRHELIGKFLAARHMRPRLSHGSEADRDRLFVLSREEVWRDAFQFIIDEIDTRQDIASLLDHLIEQGNPVSLSIAAYAFNEKPATMIPHECRDAYFNARIKLDLEPAAIMPA